MVEALAPTKFSCSASPVLARFVYVRFNQMPEEADKRALIYQISIDAIEGKPFQRKSSAQGPAY